MNIAFDMTFTLTESKNRRIGKYAKKLIRSIRREQPEHTYHFFYPDMGAGGLSLQGQLERFIHDREINLFQILSPFELTFPLLNKAWFGKSKVAVLLQEFAPACSPSRGLDEAEIRARYTKALDFVASCDLILVNSDSLKQEAIRTAGIAPEKIKLIFGGMDKRFKNMPVRMEDLRKYGIHKPYVMVTADVTDMQYLPVFIRAFERANEQMNDHYQLVITDHVYLTENEFLSDAAGKGSTTLDFVRINHVPDGELVKLYNGAKLFVYPSVDEGAKESLLEAMACGTPVLLFDRASVHSISRDAVYPVDPSNEEDIQRALAECLPNEELIMELRNKGYDRIDQLDRNMADTKAIEAYKKVLRKRIAVFAPLAPLNTDIADYMNVILPSLSEIYTCDLFVDEGYAPVLPPDVEESQFGRISHHSEFSHKAGDYDEIIYHIGSGSHHAYMVPHMREYPGIVVLHNLPQDLDANLNTAKSIIVHNRFMKKYLKQKGYSNVAFIHLPQKLPVMISLITDREFIFSSFGRINENNHIELVLRCLKKLYDEGHTDIRYIVNDQGSSQYLNKLKAFVQVLELGEVVEFKGYADKAEYQTRLSHSDACIQLHYPTEGEASGTLIDILSHGKATIISNVDAYTELPDEVVCKVAHDHQLETKLLISMQQLYKDKGLRKQLRLRSRKYVTEHHRISKYIDNLNRIVENGVVDEPEDIFAAGRPSVDETKPKAEPAVPPADQKTIYLRPNRYRRILHGGRPVSYFSFNLDELPPECKIQNAVLEIQAETKVFRVHRISSEWNSKSISRRKPPIRKYPIYKHILAKKTEPSRSTLFTWECTRLARKWKKDQSSNHGIYVPQVSAEKKPKLRLIVSGNF
ncbi:glycosyltransferase [Paenibacillus sp. GCM10027628]|uniref:glycosyltransferase n=1 Tax=Paenibacillus sp. GCM10027628 TaxID=3273413 RepID=UPI0036253E7C